MRLKDKVVLVTASTRGIGLATVQACAKEGAIVYMAARNLERASQRTEELNAMGYRVRTVYNDATDLESYRTMIEEVVKLEGRIDVLVNNAGISLQGLFQDTTDEQWDRILGVNLTGPRNTIQAVLPAMISAKRGCIVNISSIWGLRGASCEVAYACTKAAIVGMTRSLALELAPSGIRVNAVAPGCIETDMVRVLSPETRAMLVEETPLGRLGTPEDIAHAVAFLASEKASFLTGQILTADGGFIG